jgi:hypothetical protein
LERGDGSGAGRCDRIRGIAFEASTTSAADATADAKALRDDGMIVACLDALPTHLCARNTRQPLGLAIPAPSPGPLTRSPRSPCIGSFRSPSPGLHGLLTSGLSGLPHPILSVLPTIRSPGLPHQDFPRPLTRSSRSPYLRPPVCSPRAPTCQSLPRFRCPRSLPHRPQSRPRAPAGTLSFWRAHEFPQSHSAGS